jgi:hypothetical protein
MKNGSSFGENNNISHKFQYLYISDLGFREQANKLLSLCYNNYRYNGMNLTECNQILNKFTQ